MMNISNDDFENSVIIIFDINIKFFFWLLNFVFILHFLLVINKCRLNLVYKNPMNR